MHYLFIIALVFILTPFVLKGASSQNKKAKKNLKLALFTLIILQTLFVLYAIMLTFPQTFLVAFAVISAIEALLLFFAYPKAAQIVVSLNFLNTILLFLGLANFGDTSNLTAFNFAGSAAVFAVLIGNIVGLSLINKDKNLVAKFPWSLGGKQTRLQKLFTWVVFFGLIAFLAILYLSSNKQTQLKETEKLNEPVSTTTIGPQEAVEIVKNLPEVQDYLERVPKGRVELDNQSDGLYRVHVYEIKDGHTATFNWYDVDGSGNTERLFDY